MATQRRSSLAVGSAACNGSHAHLPLPPRVGEGLDRSPSCSGELASRAPQRRAHADFFSPP